MNSSVHQNPLAWRDPHPVLKSGRLLGPLTQRRSLPLLFSLLGSTLQLCASIPPSWGLCSLRFTLAGEHSPVSGRAPLFAALPNEPPALRRDTTFCFAGPPSFLGAPQFSCESGSSANDPCEGLRVPLCAFNHSFNPFVTLNALLDVKPS